MRILKRRIKFINFILLQVEYGVAPLLCFLWGSTGWDPLLILAIVFAESRALEVYRGWRAKAELIGVVLDEMDRSSEERISNVVDGVVGDSQTTKPKE